MSAVFLTLVLAELRLEQFTGSGLLTAPIMSIVGRGEILAATPSAVYHWDAAGRLELKIPFTGPRVQSAWFDGRFYWVSLSRPLESQFYDTEGNLRYTLDASDQTFEVFRFVDDQLFGVVSWSMSLIYEQPYMYQLQKIDLSFEGDKPVVRAHGSFAKYRKRQRDLLFNFRHLFLARRGDTYLVMNQVESRIFLFDEENKSRERRDGTRIPTEVDSVPLALDAFEEPPREFFRVHKPMPSVEAQRLLMNWLRSFSKIALLAEYDDGYVVSYTIPVCNDGSCKIETGVQRLDRDLNPVGAYIHLEGRTVGVYDNKFYSVVNRQDPESKEPLRVPITELRMQH